MDMFLNVIVSFIRIFLRIKLNATRTFNGNMYHILQILNIFLNDCRYIHILN